jgi:hypothetical protein
MKPLPRVWTLTFLPLAVAVISEPAQGQDACPRASGADAEAGWAAYADDAWVKRVIYRLQEFSGLSSF